ncbi:MAG TPA: hypothetical protein VKN76_08300 [Kiloniellaceae bacterium]|nr:hypothetical protein [Kiloniellaceae bacterium]
MPHTFHRAWFPGISQRLSLAALLLAAAPLQAVYGADPAPDSCASFFKQHGEYLAKGRTDLADQADGQARAAGCYNHPGDEQLCAILAEQQSQFNLDGRADLVNIIRAQEREFQCIQ